MRSSLWMSVLAAMLGLAACESAPPRPKAPTMTIRDIPAVLRGTIGAEASIAGTEPILISGLGLVVGLNGTGGGALPERVQATMERELGLKGVSRSSDAWAGTLFAGRSPQDVLRDPNVAVVLVQALVPPGAPEGTSFDVWVRALNASATTSLAGGTLWTTDLRLGQATTFGARQPALIGTARGPVFINPFKDPNQDDGTQNRIGRVLAGGTVANTQKLLQIQLDNDSPSRARAVVSAINSRFPPGSDGPIARGRGRTREGTSDIERQIIELTVPDEYFDRSDEFLRIVEHITIDQSFPQEYAKRFADAMKSQPWLADDLGWCLVAIGPAAIPFVRDLYEYPELGPRLAGLSAGAHLGDVMASPHLRELAQTGPDYFRADAIGLLGRLDAGHHVDLALKALVEASPLETRIAAYEAMAWRAEQIALRRFLESSPSNPLAAQVVDGPRAPLSMVRRQFPGTAFQPVTRLAVGGRSIADPGIFAVDVVPLGESLIYIRQQGTPKIVLLGSNLELNPRVSVRMWDDRLLMERDGYDLRLYYRDYRTGQAVTGRAESDVVKLVEFLARIPTPEDPRPGLALSYSEIVGVLYEMQTQGAIDAAFATDQDRLKADLLRANQRAAAPDRPESDAATEEIVPMMERMDQQPPEPEAPRPLVVPLEPKRKPASED